MILQRHLRLEGIFFPIIFDQFKGLIDFYNIREFNNPTGDKLDEILSLIDCTMSGEDLEKFHCFFTILGTYPEEVEILK